MSSIYRYTPFSFLSRNTENWSSLAEFWSRQQENRPVVVDCTRRLHVVLEPELLDRWNFDSRYADVLPAKNHLDGVRQLTKLLASSSSLTDLSKLKELDISIINDGDTLGTSSCDIMKPSWNLLTSLETALTKNQFDNLTTLGLKAPAYDLASLLRSASPGLRINVRSFYCTISS